MSLPLLHSPADVLSRVLIALGLATDPTAVPLGAWPAFVAGEPSSPDDVLTVYDTTPKSDGRSQIDGEQFEHYGVQVRVRAAAHAIGYAQAQAVKVALDERVLDNSVTAGAAQYLVHAVAMTSLLTLGKQTPQSKRSLFTVNGLVTLKRVA